jgi:hypothetical protein
MTVNYNLAEAVNLVHACFDAVEAEMGAFDEKLMDEVFRQAFTERFPRLTDDQLCFVIKAALCDIEGEMEERGIRP